jgi:dihydroorotate dehydrogenase electron transfer subunit
MSAKQINTTIRSMTPVGGYLHMIVDAPGVAEVEPGHFAALAVGGPNGATLLRRAFSIHKSTPGESLEFIFAPHGPGTQWLATQRAGDVIDIIAPLGKPFILPKQPISCVIVAGGYGAAPMELLARELRARNCRVDVVLGAATQEKLFGVLDLKGVSDSLIVTTDDGTSGVRGRVTDVLAGVITKNNSQAVYACGPMPMLQAVAQVSQDNGAFSQCAVEESMACGIGVCMTCVLPIIGDDGVTRMARSCVDGPVFRGDRVRWDDVDTVPSDAFGAPRPGGH